MLNLQDTLIDKAFEGISIPNTEKEALLGLYMVGMYKVLVELVASFSQDKEFHTRFLELMNEYLENFPEKTKSALEKALQQEGNTLLKGMLTTYAENLPEPHKTKMKQNLSALFSV